MKHLSKIITILLLSYIFFVSLSCSGKLPQELATDNSGQAISQSIKKLESPTQSLISFLKCLDYYIKIGTLSNEIKTNNFNTYEWREYFEVLLTPILQEAQKTNIYDLNTLYEGLGTEFYTKLIWALKMIMSFKENIKSNTELLSDITEKGLFNSIIYALNKEGANKKKKELFERARKLGKDWFDWLTKNIDKIDNILQTKYETKSIIGIIYASTFYNFLGETYMGKKNYESAITAFNKSIKSNPENTTAFFNRGKVYYLKKEFGPAVTDFSKVIKVNPKNAEAYYNLACINSLKNELDNSFEKLQQCLVLNPSMLKNVKEDPNLENLKNDPRYQNLLSQFNKKSNKK